MLRTPYLAGESDMDQLKTIFRALGTPTEQEWPVSRFFRFFLFFSFSFIPYYFCFVSLSCFLVFGFPSYILYVIYCTNEMP